ncbi:MAG: type II toxin-antitoxin system VapC family toxin [Ktedonobacterales bacterium]
MRALLDTHTFFWFLDDNPRLSATAKTVIVDGSNEILLSMASLWEMAIKISLSKLSISSPFGPYISQQLSANTIGILDISLAHVAAVIALPFHHRDPFDRLLIAQAQIEQIPLISVDTVFDAYAVRRLW